MDWVEVFDRQTAALLPDVRVLREEAMAKHTSFRTGGPAKRMAFPERGEQLVLLLSLAAECGARPFVMGNGTNLLAPDEGLDRLVSQETGIPVHVAERPLDCVVEGTGKSLEIELPKSYYRNTRRK